MIEDIRWVNKTTHMSDGKKSIFHTEKKLQVKINGTWVDVRTESE